MPVKTDINIRNIFKGARIAQVTKSQFGPKLSIRDKNGEIWTLLAHPDSVIYNKSDRYNGLGVKQ